VSAAGIVLAAGLGRRFGGRKMLADVGGRPMLQHVLDLAARVALSPVIVVLGADADAIEAAIDWRAEQRVRNPNPAEGLASSLRLAVAEVAGSERAVVLLGDQPFVTVDQVRSLLAAPRNPRRPIVVPLYQRRPGNPVLLEREAWALASRLTGDRGMSQLFESRPELVRHVDLPGANPDIDTRADLNAVSRA
jgi:molybdenum cofactor cytidylyltransferase